jgi:hypothetical protein
MHRHRRRRRLLFHLPQEKRLLLLLLLLPQYRLHQGPWVLRGDQVGTGRLEGGVDDNQWMLCAPRCCHPSTPPPRPLRWSVHRTVRLQMCRGASNKKKNN